MKWMITGGCGFIGCALVDYLVSEGGHEIRVVDNLSVGSRDDLNSVTSICEAAPENSEFKWDQQVSLFCGDILDKDLMLKACSGADVVVHLAANTGVGPSVENPQIDCHTNVVGTLNVLEGCRANKVKRFVFASSGAPLGVQSPPLNEKMAPHPASPYGASKLAGEGYCSAYFHCFGVQTIALRFGNVYGRGSNHKGSVIAKFIKQAMLGQEIEIYGDGQQTRDFIYISDLIRAILLSARVSNVGGEVFQIATSSETTVFDMLKLLTDELQRVGIPAPKVRYGSARAGDVLRNYSDTSKAHDMLGWKAEVSLVEGLSETVEYFKLLKS